MTVNAAGLRAMVLAHPDLAERLTQPPLSYQRPEQWNGFVPPDTFNGQHNDSPRRAALVAIVAEAESRKTKTSTEGKRR
jgi:hypothetical protein